MSHAFVLSFPFGGLVETPAADSLVAALRPYPRDRWSAEFAGHDTAENRPACPHRERCLQLGCLGFCQPPTRPAA